ncbi:MAG TPA: ATP-binding protein [Chlamydiales bacterium]|nr:ATP-binding protein [Chlamydiales bacterium]
MAATAGKVAENAGSALSILSSSSSTSLPDPNRQTGTEPAKKIELRNLLTAGIETVRQLQVEHKGVKLEGLKIEEMILVVGELVADSKQRKDPSSVAKIYHDLGTPILNMKAIVKENAMGEEINIDDLISCRTELGNQIEEIPSLEAMQNFKPQLKLKAFKLDDLCNRVRSQTSSYAKNLYRGVVIKFEYERLSVLPGKNLKGDARKIARILKNLISNACKFSPAGGTVTVRISEEGSGLDSIRLKFSVIDQGPGIPKETQERLFKDYVQLEQPEHLQEKTTGLGLASCAELAALMNDQPPFIGVVSQLGEGSTFWFTVNLGIVTEKKEPIAESPQFDAPGASPATRNELIGSPKVLIFEDHPMSGNMLRRQLTRAKAGLCEWREDVESGLAEFKMHQDYDVLIIDNNMPYKQGMDNDTNGWQIIQTIRALAGNKIPRMLICTASDQNLRAELTAHGIGNDVPIVMKGSKEAVIDEINQMMQPSAHIVIGSLAGHVPVIPE